MIKSQRIKEQYNSILQHYVVPVRETPRRVQQLGNGKRPAYPGRHRLLKSTRRHGAYFVRCCSWLTRVSPYSALFPCVDARYCPPKAPSELRCATPGLIKRIVFPNSSSHRQLDECSLGLPALEHCEQLSSRCNQHLKKWGRLFSLAADPCSVAAFFPFSLFTFTFCHPNTTD